MNKTILSAVLCTLLAIPAFAYDIDELIADAKAHYDRQYSEVADFTIKQEASMNSPQGQGMSMDMTMYRMGELWRVEGSMSGQQGGLSSTTLFDGENVWTSTMGMKTKLPKDEALQQQSTATFFQEPPAGSEVIGEESVNGHDCWIVKWPENMSDDGATTTWIDKDKFVNIQSTHQLSGKEMKVVQSDFRAIHGDFELPHKTEVFSDGNLTMTATITDVSYNDGLSADLFDASKLEGGGMPGMGGGEIDMEAIMKQAEEMKKKYGGGEGE